jgi:hypothetical protein
MSSPGTIIDWDERNQKDLQLEEAKLLNGLEPEPDLKLKLRYMDFIRILRRNKASSDNTNFPNQIRQLVAGMQYFDIKIQQMEL